MKPHPENISINVMDIQAATAALHRAAELAQKTAIETDTCLVIMENGEVVHIPAQRLCQQAKGTQHT